MDEEKRFFRRHNILLGLFALCLILFIAILYNAQVVNGAEYLSQSTTQVTTPQTVEAYRGILTDRNGKTLISNQEIYTIDFDPALVEAEDGASRQETVARALLRLIRLCQEQGFTWTDTLPVSQYAPITYTTYSATETHLSRFQKYLHKQGWSDSQLSQDTPYPQMSTELKFQKQSVNDVLSCSILLDLFRSEYGIPQDFSPEEIRLVAGVLYELDLRSMEILWEPYTFLDHVPVELIAVLTDGNFAGVVIDKKSVRQYNTEYAAHILGRMGAIDSTEELARLNADYTAAKEAGESTAGIHHYSIDDRVGKQGAEQAFESYLRGKDGTRLITTNEDGKITSELYSLEPEPGGTVALTIDIDFQAAVEQALAETVQAMNTEDGSQSRGAAAAVVSVADSDVLALASYPTYQLSTYGQDYNTNLENPGKPFVNRALNGTYAPGSTFKLCTSVAALESGIITPATKIRDEGRYMYYYSPNPAASYTPACWIYNQSGGTHGRINVAEAIYHSCNYFFYEVGRLMGIETLNSYASAFGLGQKTGIELGEETGILDGPEYRSQTGSLWVGGTVLACAIGQGDSLFTPLQLANYTATLVRGGQRYNAHLLESVTTYDGSDTIFTHETEVVDTVEMSAATLSAVKKGMGDLVTSGSISQYFKDCVVSAGAKTGSAQTSEAVANGVFVCFAPFDEPEIAVAIVIEQGGSGAALASTAVNILNSYFSPSDIGTALIPEGTLLP